MKNLYFIRHGYALHNQLFFRIGREAYDIRDTQLLDKGVEQAKKLNKTWDKIDDIDLVICSPSIRTLDTALTIFKGKHMRIVAHDFLLEYPQGSEECNRRKDREDLKVLYPQIDFSNLKQNVLPWNLRKETIQELDNRVDQMFEWLEERNEKNIAIVSHSSFIGHFKDGVMGDEDNELEHCFPYLIRK